MSMITEYALVLQVNDVLITVFIRKHFKLTIFHNPLQEFQGDTIVCDKIFILNILRPKLSHILWSRFVLRLRFQYWPSNGGTAGKMRLRIIILCLWDIQIPSCRWFRNDDNRSKTLVGLSNWLSEFQHVVDSETTTPGIGSNTLSG